MRVRQTMWLLALGAACGGGSGDADAGADAAAADGSVDDASTMDSAVDADAGFDAGVDRLDGPRDSEPGETALEPGSDADDVYRYCWFLTETFCRGHHACCEDLVFGDDPADCHETMLRGFCEIWLDRPEAVGPQDVEALEANLERLADAADECGELAVKFVFAFGNLPVGADCSSEAHNPTFLCGEEAWCVDDVCTPLPRLGEPCSDTPSGQCVDSYCSPDDVCAPREGKPVGEACEGWGECATNRCEEGSCIERAESPWCFRR